MAQSPDSIPLPFQRLSPTEQQAPVQRFVATMASRRSVRGWHHLPR